LSLGVLKSPEATEEHLLTGQLLNDIDTFRVTFHGQYT